MKRFLFGIIGAFIVALIIGFVQIDDLRADIASMQNTINNNIHRLENNISEIYQNVDEQMKKEASMFTGVSHSLVGLDREARRIMLSVSVVPKTIVDGMRVTLSVGETNEEMKNSEGGVYTAVISVGMFEEYDTYPLVTIRKGNEKTTEYLESVGVSYLWSNYLPTLEHGEIWNDSVTFREESEARESTLTIDGHIEFSYCKAKMSPDLDFDKIYIVAEIEGGEIAKKDITEMVRSSQYDEAVAISAPLREVYKIGESEELYLYIVAEDTLGYTHKIRAFEWYRPQEDDAREPDTAPEWAGVRDMGERIYDKDGRLVFGNEF